MDWSAPTDWGMVCQRAAGRRKFNELRQALACERQQQVWEFMAGLGQLLRRPEADCPGAPGASLNRVSGSRGAAAVVEGWGAGSPLQQRRFLGLPAGSRPDMGIPILAPPAPGHHALQMKRCSCHPIGLPRAILANTSWLFVAYSEACVALE